MTNYRQIGLKIKILIISLQSRKRKMSETKIKSARIKPWETQLSSKICWTNVQLRCSMWAGVWRGLIHLFLHAPLYKALVFHSRRRRTWLQDPTHALGRWYSMWWGEVVYKVSVCYQGWPQKVESNGWRMGKLEKLELMFKILWWGNQKLNKRLW